VPQRLLSAGAVATSPALGMEMLAVAVAAGIDSDSILGTSNFRAKALTDAFIMTNGEMYGFSGDTSIDGQVAGRYFYGKILEAMDAGGSNPHAMFPDPCDPTYANTAASSLDIIMGMYTKFIIIDSERERRPVRENNIVEVRLAYVGHEYELSAGAFVKYIAPGESPTSSQFSCDSPLTDEFKKQGFVTMDDYANMSGEHFSAEVKDNFSYYKFPLRLSVLEADAQEAFEAFFAELQASKYSYKINSTRRSVKHQWGMYVGILPALTPARPCSSDHQYGYAIDMNPIRPDGTFINSQEPDSEWQPVVDIANKHNIRWQGSKDRVHFYFGGASSTKTALKKKCTDYYYGKYGSDPMNWPTDFADEIEYINTPVGGMS
jgi:hypothetical protein